MEANNTSVGLDRIFRNLSLFAKAISMDDDAAIPGDSLLVLRVTVAVVYSLVCAFGLTGNVLVMHLIRTQSGQQISTINVFVFSLALTDFQLALTLPFWAVDSVLDFSWPFGGAMCKVILTITVLNIYTNVFLLTAMSVTRYWSVVSAVSHKSRLSARAAKWICLVLWLIAIVATIPTTVFSEVINVAGEELCLLKFPKVNWLGIYHIQKIILAFLLPLVVISVSYLLLLRFLSQHYVNTNNPNRHNKVSNSIRLLVLAFFICWFPNHAATFWGVLLKLGVIDLNDTLYFFHMYIFPITICLAHSNSCLNPIIYCLMRKEFRGTLKTTFWHISSSLSRYLSPAVHNAEERDMRSCMPLDQSACQGFPHQYSLSGSRHYIPDSTTLTNLQDKDKEVDLENCCHDSEVDLENCCHDSEVDLENCCHDSDSLCRSSTELTPHCPNCDI